MTDIANLAFQVNTKSLASASTSLKNFKKVGEDTERSIMRNTSNIKTSFQSVAPAISGTGKAAATASPKMAGFGHQARMMSMQLSQVAQQGSVTGNYLQALAIQLPDLMLGFGTLGIIIGAVAGSLAMPLINALKGAGGELEKFNEEVRDGTIDLERLGEAQRLVFSRQQVIKISETQDSIDGYTESIAKAQLELDRLDRIQASYGMSQFEIDRLTKNATESMQDLTAAREIANTTLEKQKSLLDQVNKGESAETTKKRIEDELDARKNLASALQNIEQGMESPTSKLIREASERAAILQAAQDAEIESIRSYDDLKRENAQRLSNDLVEITKREQEQKNQLLTAGQQQGLSIMSGQLGQMAALAKEGGEKQFENWKALATAQAVVSTALAVANANSVPVIGPALAVTAGILGAAQIGIIQNTEYQGARAMGGQVEGGGKYLVGENGPEVLQLGNQGGSVTPNHALGGGGGNVTTVVNIAAGVTKAELEAFAPTIIKTSVNAVKQQIAAGGTMSRAVGRR